MPIHDTGVKVTFNFNTHCILESKETLRDALKETILSDITNNSCCLVWFPQYCIAIILKRCAREITKYAIFDSHSKNQCGNIVENGTCTLITTTYVADLIEYFCDIYLNESNNYQVAYQVQFINYKSSASIVRFFLVGRLWEFYNMKYVPYCD